MSCALEAQGFSDAEWAAAKQQVMQDLDQRGAGMMTIANVDLARELGQSSARGESAIGPNELRDHARTWLATLSAELGNRWWRDQWRSGVQHVRVESPELGLEKDPTRAIRAAMDEGFEQRRGCRVSRL